jgi:hypothetical protein
MSEPEDPHGEGGPSGTEGDQGKPVFRYIDWRTGEWIPVPERSLSPSLPGGLVFRKPAGASSYSVEQEPFDPARHKAEQQALAAAHKQRQEAERATFDREQESKDREQKRFLEKAAVIVAAIVVVVMLVFGSALIIWGGDSARQAGLAVDTLILGGIAGGFGGYIAGKGAR